MKYDKEFIISIWLIGGIIMATTKLINWTTFICLYMILGFLTSKVKKL